MIGRLIQICDYKHTGVFTEHTAVFTEHTGVFTKHTGVLTEHTGVFIDTRVCSPNTQVCSYLLQVSLSTRMCVDRCRYHLNTLSVFRDGNTLSVFRDDFLAVCPNTPCVGSQGHSDVFGRHVFACSVTHHVCSPDSEACSHV